MEARLGGEQAGHPTVGWALHGDFDSSDEVVGEVAEVVAGGGWQLPGCVKTALLGHC